MIVLISDNYTVNMIAVIEFEEWVIRVETQMTAGLTDKQLLDL